MTPFPSNTIGLGLAPLSIAYGKAPPDSDRLALLDKALELGCYFWDTAQVYGDSEDLLCKFLASRPGAREKVFLCTKFGIGRNPQTGKMDAWTSAEDTKKGCEAALKRMNVQHIDLFYAHRCNPETPIQETMRAMVELQNEGKIKHIGFSEISSKALRRASKIGKVAAVQLEYSPFELDNEEVQDVITTCRELGTSVVCYCPLGRGLLTGEFSNAHSVSGEGDIRSFHYPRFARENLEDNAEVIKHFSNFAVVHDMTAAQLALAWLLKQGGNVIPIPGTKKMRYLKENCEAMKMKLSCQQESEVRQLVRALPLHGTRSQENNAFSYTDTREEA